MSNSKSHDTFESTIPRLRPITAGPLPWEFLNEFRAKAIANPADHTGDKPRFSGAWPSIPTMFAISVARFPDRPCHTVYEEAKRTKTFAEVHADVRALAGHLSSLGVLPGDRVALCGKNSPEWALSWLGILCADGIVVPIDASLRPAEASRLITASGAKVYLGDADHLVLDPQPSLSATIHMEKDLPSIVTSKPKTIPIPLREGKDTAAIMYTSGTMGNPKGVMLSHENLVSDAYLSQYHMPIYPSDVFYALLPLHHSYTMQAVLIVGMSAGAEVVFGSKMVVAQILRDLKQAQVTMFLGVPLLFNRLLAGILRGIREKGPIVYGIIRTLMAVSGFIKKAFGKNPGKKLFHTVLSKASLDTIRICISGGGPLPPTTFRRFNQLGIDFVQGYGLTESSPIIALNPVWRYKEASVGALIPGMEAKILEPDLEGRGEILVRGPVVMSGYWENASASAEAVDSDGFLHTGDVGWIDDENYIFLTGRAKNMIVTEGGKNVYPEEIENYFQLYPEIDQVLIRGWMPDKGSHAEEIEALIFPNEELFRLADGTVDRSAASARISQIIATVNGSLHGHQKIVRHTVLEQAMEMTSTKKIRRFSVAATR